MNDHENEKDRADIRTVAEAQGLIELVYEEMQKAYRELEDRLLGIEDALDASRSAYITRNALRAKDV